MANKKRSINERLRDRAIAHAINLQRYSNSEARAMLRVLNSADADLFAKISTALERVPPTSFTVKRLDAALSGVWAINEQVYRRMNTRGERELKALTELELRSHTDNFGSLLPEGEVHIGVPSMNQVYAAAMAEPFRGRLMGEWYSSLAEGRKIRIRDEIRQGYIQGLTVQEMVRKVRGTRAQNYADGIIQVDRNYAESIVRTAIAHTAAVARDEFYRANEDIIKEEQWLSTLDSRTTPECILRDGLKYTADEDHSPVGHKVPWLEGPGKLHWGCRSVSIPVIDSAGELGLDLPPVERAALNGVAAPGTTYREWLAAQPASRQDDVLGITRAKLFRQGKLPIERFFNDKGSLLTLAELRERNAKLFAKE